MNGVRILCLSQILKILLVQIPHIFSDRLKLSNIFDSDAPQITDSLTQTGGGGGATLDNREKKTVSFRPDCNKAILLPLVCSALEHDVSEVIHCIHPPPLSL
jgi:hypothetical protein